MTMLAVFRSRSQTLQFISVLRANGIPAQAASTPKEANTGCGISAKFEEAFLPRVRYFLSAARYSSFSGLMKRTGNVYAYCK